MTDKQARINKRQTDTQLLNSWISNGARVLDLGCGRGVFLEQLKASRKCLVVGVDNNFQKIASCIKRGVPAYQGDLLDTLSIFEEDSFDWVVCSRTLQELIAPEQVLLEALRVGRRLAIGFVNHGYWVNRWSYFASGGRIQNTVYPDPWYRSRPINPISIAAFHGFCEAHNIDVLRAHHLAGDWKTPVRFWPNLLAGYAVYELAFSARA